MEINLPKRGGILIDEYTEEEISLILDALNKNREKHNSCRLSSLKIHKYLLWSQYFYLTGNTCSALYKKHEILIKDKEQSNPNNDITSEPKEDILPDKGAVRVHSCSQEAFNYIVDVLRLHKEEPELELKVFNAKKRKRLTQDVAIVSTTQFKLK